MGSFLESTIPTLASVVPKNFRYADINNAIVLTIADLDGYHFPGPNAGSIRLLRGEDQKPFCGIPFNLIDCAAGHQSILGPPVMSFGMGAPFEIFLMAAGRLLVSCNGYQVPAITHLLTIMLREDRERKIGLRDGHYLWLINKENFYGKALLALCQSFGVKIPEDQLNWPEISW